MRILFLTPEFPYPADSGGRMKTLSLLEYLRARHDVDVVCFRRRPLTPAQLEWSSRLGIIRTAHLDRGRNLANLARSYISRVPLSIERNRSSRMRDLVAQSIESARFEAVFVDGWLMAQYLPAFPSLKLLHEHNAESIIWRRQAELERNPLRRVLVSREARRVQCYEQRILQRFDVVFAVSEPDRRALLQLGADAIGTAVLPNIPDASLLERSALSFAASEPLVLYFGTLSWQPNVEGVERLISHIFPQVARRLPQARLLVAGRGATPALRRLIRANPTTEYLEDTPNAEPLYRRARVFVEATSSGGGTKLKVLNSLARGLPVVASSEAAEGLEAVPGEHLLVQRDEPAIADAVVRLMTDAPLWQRLSENGRDLIRRSYRPELAFAALDNALSTRPAPV